MNLTNLSEINQIEEETILKKMMRGMQFGAALKHCGFNKKRAGETAYTLIYRIMASLYVSKSLKTLWMGAGSSLSQTISGTCGKNSYYRFLKQTHHNWRGLIRQISGRIVGHLKKTTPHKETVLIIDDTPIEKRGKKIELLSTQYNHATHRMFRGFTQVHLGWSDGKCFIPLDFCVKVGKKILNSTQKDLDKRRHGYKRRAESNLSKLEQSIQMLKSAYRSGIDAAYVVFDTWFSKPVFISNVLEAGYHCVFQLSKSPRIWSLNYQGQNYGLKALYRILRTQKSFEKIQIGNISQSIASVIVKHSNGLELKLVFCRLGRKNWAVFGTTDIDQTDLEILKTYTKRWGIEPYFKEAKQLFRLGKEQSTDFDMQISLTSIRMIAYTLTSYMKRLSDDERTIGDLFAIVTNDFSRFNLNYEILERIFRAVLDAVQLSDCNRMNLLSMFDYICQKLTSKSLIFQIPIGQAA